LHNLSQQEADRQIFEELKRQGAVKAGDLIIVTRGDIAGQGGGTNTMKIVKVS